MSISRQRELVTAYDCSLEQQILRQGSNLVCRDEDLWKQVEGLLRNGDAQEMHCLGLDPLRVMEESLEAAAETTAASTGKVKARGGLQGLAKAFEVVEQAALNLYLGPWREEYKVVKMYSGIFTHYVKPVLSMPQIEKLFSLLGYQLSSSRHEQLHLQSPRVSPGSLDDLLRLSCAFFLARCECCLLLKALGKHVGDAQWELNVVRERQRGNRLQVALDNTKKMLEVNQPSMKQFDGELDVDLYTDEQLNGGQRETDVTDNENPRSLTWVTHSSALAPAVKTQSNGVTSLSSSHNPLTTRDDIRTSTLKCQLMKTSPLASDTTRSSSASMKQGKHPSEETTFDMGDSQSSSLQVEAMGLDKIQADVSHFCSCLQSSPICLRHCVQCNTLHDITCASLQQCQENHCVVVPNNTNEKMGEQRAVSLQGESLRVSQMGGSPALTSSSAAMSSLTLCDDPKAITPSIHPITYHECCDLRWPDPQVLCLRCSVLHSGSCKEIDICKSYHEIKSLGVCSCGRACSRKPLVLCRYCGKEYCRDCWYRSPLECVCGQTFDQSSSV
ncbi:spermatogenesis associated 2-like [Acanthopagrus latus]|uniref:spermatogenesis associated 2-like n=1 Tax=Acanthopagrus latus TaxID=8177 RepID=UPI00187C48E3|nr:spermatogenesis associated 2-like [Acanthopagrus latus]XP_036962213.1 spermatogenesis associated 2-like [Acanthopagrus latus]XP_036962214.1 spermatogenesis associated 2-like [Acanthopagrus latus]